MASLNYTEQQSAENRKVFLGFIWGLSIILYEIEDAAASTGFLSRALSVVAFGAAVFLTVRPKLDVAWLALSILVPLQVLSLLPKINNHSVLFAILGVAIAVSYIHGKYVSKNKPANWLKTNEPFVRLVFLLGYGAAALAKLNAGFFNYQISCANSMAKSVYSWLPFKIPFETFQWLPYLVSATELFVFFGLMFSKSRSWALVVAVAFHFALSLNIYAAGLAFNPALYSMLVFFLPSSASNRIVELARNMSHQIASVSKNLLPGSYALFVIVIFIFWKLMPANSSLATPSFIIETIFALVLVATIAYGALAFKNDPIDGDLAKASNPLAVVVVVVLLLNAAMPYLGGKTGATLTMYSNLRVEGGKSNHFIFPRLPIKTAQDDLVQVTASSNPALYNLYKTGTLITFTTLQQAAISNPEMSVSYIREGKTFSVSKVKDDRALNDINPIWAYFAFYRNVPTDGTCVW